MNRIYRFDSFYVEQKESDYSGNKQIYDIIHRKDCVIMLPFIKDKFVMINEYRISIDKSILQFPSGKIEISEDADIAALRETKEETGYIAKKCEYIGGFYSAPHFSDEYFHVYYLSNITRGNKKLTKKESMDNVLLSPEEVEESIINGKIIDAKTIVAFYYWKKRWNRERF